MLEYIKNGRKKAYTCLHCKKVFAPQSAPEIFYRFRKEKAPLMRVLQIFNSARSALSAVNGFCRAVFIVKTTISRC